MSKLKTVKHLVESTLYEWVSMFANPSGDMCGYVDVPNSMHNIIQWRESYEIGNDGSVFLCIAYHRKYPQYLFYIVDGKAMRFGREVTGAFAAHCVRVYGEYLKAQER